MEKVYILSKYINDKNQQYYFNFKGIYQGKNVTSIIINSEIKLDIAEEYLIYLLIEHFEDEVIRGKALKVKKLFATFPH